MDEEIERLLVSVRADTALFARDVASMRAELEGPFADSLGKAGRTLENALTGAVRTGKLDLEDLKRTALSAMAEIASAAIRSGIGSILGGSGGQGLVALGGQLLGAMLGLPGRATGGPVSAGRAYLVGERGPELFVPTASGRIEAGRAAAARDIRLNISINAPAGAEPRALEQSGRQIARAVKAALLRVED